MLSILEIIATILGAAENIIPIFVHNPKSQAVEGIIVTTTNAAMEALAGAVATPAVPVPVPITAGVRA